MGSAAGSNDRTRHPQNEGPRPGTHRLQIAIQTLATPSPSFRHPAHRRPIRLGLAAGTTLYGPTAADPGEPPASKAPGASTAVVPTSSVQSAPSATVGSIPETGPGLTRPGILLIASPASDGTFDVLERIRPLRPVSVLTLRPAPVDRAGRQFASASAAATQVQVSAGDQPVLVPGAKVGAAMDLPVAQVGQFELRYRLTGVTVRSTPSTAGRALAAIGPLTGGVDDDLPVLFIVSGGTVLGLNCPLLPLSQQSCGTRVQDPPSVEHELPGRLALTSVQYDLPPV